MKKMMVMGRRQNGHRDYTAHFLDCMRVARHDHMITATRGLQSDVLGRGVLRWFAALYCATALLKRGLLPRASSVALVWINVRVSQRFLPNLLICPARC